MTEITMRDGQVRLLQGDCREVLRGLADNSIDSVVTDPPYALVSIQKRFGKAGSAPAKRGTDGLYARASAGFMGKQWDTGEAAFAAEFWAEVMRVLKPGGHVLAFGGTRTQHRLVCAIEDAGFEIRDQIGWAYGSGFPKSHNQHGDWEGWGTALKPAWEPIVVARKPLDGTVAGNLAEWGVGALNIEASRVPVTGADVGQTRTMQRGERAAEDGWGMGATADAPVVRPEGRWPANLIHDGSDEVLAAFPDAPGQMAKAAMGDERRTDQNVYGAMTRGSNGSMPRVEIETSAARFFYSSKASRADRDAGLSSHVIVEISGSEEWENADLKVLLRVDTATSPPRVIGASGAQNNSVGAWSTMLSGSENADLSRQITTCITGIGTSSTTTFSISNSYPNSITSENTPAANCETENGGSHAESAASGGQSPTFISAEMASVLGVSPAASQTRLKISASAGRCSHPTVKPTDLMRYLCRLVTPPGGVVLDPFMGSGSTGKAAVLEGFQFVGVEREDEYMPIAAARVAWAVGQMDRPDAPLKKRMKAANDNGHADLMAGAA